MSRKGVDLGGDGDANVALNPIVGLAREDLLGAVSVMLRETAAKPSTTLKQVRHCTRSQGQEVCGSHLGEKSFLPHGHAILSCRAEQRESLDCGP